MPDELALSLKDMENNGGWKVFKPKPVCSSRWVVWNAGWLDQNWPPLQFDTWQEAIDYVNGKCWS